MERGQNIFTAPKVKLAEERKLNCSNILFTLGSTCNDMNIELFKNTVHLGFGMQRLAHWTVQTHCSPWVRHAIIRKWNISNAIKFVNAIGNSNDRLCRIQDEWGQQCHQNLQYQLVSYRTAPEICSIKMLRWWWRSRYICEISYDNLQQIITSSWQMW